MLPELCREEISDALDRVAAEALEDAAWDAPPVDGVQLAQSLRLCVALDSSQGGRARFVRLRNPSGGQPRGSILLRPDPRPEREQWAICHEIGEHLAVRVFHCLGVDPREAPPNTRESVANQLAGRLLLPRAWFHREALRVHWDLMALKQRFATASHELIARRMLDFAPTIMVTIFDHGTVTFRANSFGGRTWEVSPVERRCWQRVHETGFPRTAVDRRQVVQCWPIHEVGWKREILRTLVDLEVDGDEESPCAAERDSATRVEIELDE